MREIASAGAALGRGDRGLAQGQRAERWGAADGAAGEGQRAGAMERGEGGWRQDDGWGRRWTGLRGGHRLAPGASWPCFALYNSS